MRGRIFCVVNLGSNIDLHIKVLYNSYSIYRGGQYGTILIKLNLKVPTLDMKIKHSRLRILKYLFSLNLKKKYFCTWVCDQMSRNIIIKLNNAVLKANPANFMSKLGQTGNNGINLQTQFCTQFAFFRITNKLKGTVKEKWKGV